MRSILHNPATKFFAIFFIAASFLFFKNAARAAITVTQITGAVTTTAATTQVTASFTPVANRLYLMWTIQTIGTTPPTTPTVACANGLTMVQVNTRTFSTNATPLNRITLFRGMKASGLSAGTCTISWGQTTTGHGHIVVEYSGVDTSGTDGSGAVVQSVVGSTDNATAGAGLSLTLAALQAGSTTAGGFSNNVNSATSLSAGTGYTAGTGFAFNNPATSIRAEWNTTGSATVNMTQSATSHIGGIAVEVRGADVAAPTPNPMTFASVSTNDSATQISMTSTAGSDFTTPVNYLFTNNNTSCGTNAGTGGVSSAWQASTAYSNSGLQANKCYGYTVTARDSVIPTPNTGTASSISSTYTSANTPGTPTLNGATVTTLNLTNAENSNPAANPTTNFAVQVVTTSPSDTNWLNKWVDASGNPVAAAVWLTDAQLDALVLHSLQSSTLYGAKVKARNNDTDETALSAEGQGTTLTPAASGSVSANPTTCTISSGQNTCTVPFTWSISNATTPNLYNATTLVTYSSSASGTNISYAITNGANTVNARDGSTVLASVSVSASCTSGTTWSGGVCVANAVPTVTTPTATSITNISATLGANVTSLGVPASITARGTCWGTSPAPLTNCLAEGGTTTGIFTQARTGMSAGILYYYRGYATNSTGTGYSIDGTFTTTTTYGSVSANPTTCTISSGQNTCTVPFTWSISNATTPNLYNATTLVTYSSSASGTNISYAITNGANTVNARDGSTVLASVSVSASCTSGTTWSGGGCVPTTIIGDGTDPTSMTVAPESGTDDLDYFTLETSMGTDIVTAVTVTLLPAGAYNNISQVDLTDNNNVTKCTSILNPASNTLSFSSCNISVTTAAATYKVRITSKTHALMPPPSVGESYATTGTVTTFTSTNTSHVISDTSSATITIDNLSPLGSTGASATAGDAQISVSWTNPLDADLLNLVVLRDTATIGSGSAPAEGSSPTMGSSCGGTVCQVRYVSSETSFVDTGLANDTTYYYRIFAKDYHGNYTAYSSTQQVSAKPSATTFTITSSAGPNGSITPLGATSVAQGGSQTYTLTPAMGYIVATLTIDGSTTATSTSSYIFTNVQAPHAISVTFLLAHTITSSAGAGGTIAPLGPTTVIDGVSQSYTITPINGYNIETLIVDTESIATSTFYTFSPVTTDHTISATFALIPPPPGTFAITATAGTGGTISPSGVTIVTQGNSQAYTITPNSGYDLATLTVDSVSVATSTTYTLTNIQTNHTIDATFVALPAGAILHDIGTTRATSIIFSGKAFPNGIISVIDKQLNTEKILGQKDIAGEDGSFNISFIGVLQALHSFGLLAKDQVGRVSQSKFFFIDTISNDFVVKDLLLPPTTELEDRQVTRGSNAVIVGSATPSYTIKLELDGILTRDMLAGKDGAYRFEIPTGALEFGAHTIKTKQVDPLGEKTSDFSTSRTLTVSRLVVVQADLNSDGKMDIRDWSIFLSLWGSKNTAGRDRIDFNKDGKIDISDFSILIKTIRKK